MKKIILSLFVFSAAGLSPVRAETVNSWLRTRFLDTALNPKISVIPDFVWTTGPTSADGGANLREVELAIQSDVDTYGRADIFIAFPTAEGKSPEIEEAYFTLTSLPGRIQARGGRFFANFGRLNMVHEHELDQTNKPLVLERFLGEEGLRATGGEASWIAGLGSLFVEASYGLSNDLGAEEEETTADVCTNAACTTTVSVKVEESETPHKRVRDLAHISRVRFYGDINDATNLELGLSGAIHQPGLSEHRRLGGLDMTFRWKPEEKSLYRSFLWRSEFLYSHRELQPEEDATTGAITASAADTDRRGFYTYAQYQPLRRWTTGLRFDYAESPTDREKRAPQRRVAPYLTFHATEFQRFRGQYEYRRLAGGQNEHRGTFQWTLVLGPHGAHPY